MKKYKITNKKIFLFTLMLAFIFMTISSPLETYAKIHEPEEYIDELEDHFEKGKDENDINRSCASYEEKVFGSMMCFDDDNGNGTMKNYNLDVVPDDYHDDESAWDTFKNIITLSYASDSIIGSIYWVVNFLLSGVLNWNIFFTTSIIYLLDFAYDTTIVNLMIDELSSEITRITGINANGFIGSSGLFGTFIKVIALSSAIYGLFMIIFKRSVIASFEEMLKTLAVIVLAILLFTNYAPFLKSINNISSDLSRVVMSVGHDFNDVDSNDHQINTDDVDTFEDSEEDRRENMKKNIWRLFVERPYTFMMLGHTNLDEIENGQQRLDRLLKYKNGTDTKNNILKTELGGYDNTSITFSEMNDRIAFTPLYLLINIAVAIPLLILVLSLIIFQIWFIIIAMFAPFALIVSAIPGQFNVFKRYMLELTFPLMSKVGVTFMMLLLFMVSETVYSLDSRITSNSTAQTYALLNPIGFYVFLGIFNMLIFLVFFMLRKRLKDILMAGSDKLREFKDTKGNPLKEPFQKTMSTAGAVAGAVVGGVTTGGVGTMAGASIGSSLGGTAGKALTGDAEVGEMAQAGMRAYTTTQLASLGNDNKMDQLQTDTEKQDHESMIKNLKSETPLNTMNTESLNNVYENLNARDKNDIINAGKDLEQYNTLQSIPMSKLTPDEVKQMKEFELTDLNKVSTKTFDDLSSMDKYRILKENGNFGSNINIPNPRKKSDINIEDQGLDNIMKQPINNYSMNDLNEIGNHLNEPQKEKLTKYYDDLNNFKHHQHKETSLGDYVGYEAKSANKPVEYESDRMNNPVNNNPYEHVDFSDDDIPPEPKNDYDDSPYHNRGD